MPSHFGCLATALWFGYCGLEITKMVIKPIAFGATVQTLWSNLFSPFMKLVIDGKKDQYFGEKIKTAELKFPPTVAFGNIGKD